jgi:hypothetical protein
MNIAQTVEYFGIIPLSRLLQITPQLLLLWTKRGVPTTYAAKVERVTLGVFRRKDDRPSDWMEIWPELAYFDWHMRPPREGLPRAEADQLAYRREQSRIWMQARRAEEVALEAARERKKISDEMLELEPPPTPRQVAYRRRAAEQKAERQQQAEQQPA